MANTNINLYEGNNSLQAEITGLQLKADQSFVNDATVNVTIYEEDGTTQVTGVSWPISMDYVAASDGIYRGIISHTSNIVNRSKYKVVVSATDTGGNQGEWIEWAIAKRRRFT